MASRMHAEGGAVAATVGLLLPVLLAALAFASGVLVLAGAERELQRASSAAALAAAGRVALLDGSALIDPLPALASLPPPTSPSALACPVAAANLTRAPLSAGFALPSTDTGSCAPSDAPSNATVRVGVREDGFDRALRDLWPLLDSPPLGAVNVRALLPALLTPVVDVDARATIQTPFAQLLGRQQASRAVASASARRRFKNAVVVPSTTVLCSVDGIEQTFDTLATLLPTTAGLLEGCRVDLNAGLAAIGDDLFAYLDRVADELRALSSILPEELPVAPACLVDALAYELRAVYDPPDRGPDAATQARALVANAAGIDPSDAGEDVLLLVVNAADGMAVPILDAVPVAARDLVSEQPLRATDGEGAYRATLHAERDVTPRTTGMDGCS